MPGRAPGRFELKQNRMEVFPLPPGSGELPRIDAEGLSNPL